ncbi:MAG: exodeoxyribonuclease VII large subunit, partial [Muribaculaceae bacterium]|nr:exodeoxyribonuclease VII large subunit [Muribaculaceae bacterium]
MQDLNLSQPQAISLLEFNGRIKRLLNDSSVLNCWVMAETSDVRINRHCYLELLQKNPNTGETIARIRAVIWANTFQRLSYNFMQVTGQPFNNGMKVMVLVSASFHEQYGMSLVINDINPEFTLGDMARRRIEIIQRLTSEGIINMNKELEWPEVPQRIAVISAQGAAGYGDCMNQLRNNPYGLKFYTALFGAVMQGQQTVPSVIAALEKIGANEDLFDCVVIIRGGGSTTD